MLLRDILDDSVHHQPTRFVVTLMILIPILMEHDHIK